MIFIKKYNIHRFIVFIILSIVLLSCSKKRDAYLFYNKDYYTLFENQLRVYNIIKKKLNRYFFNVNEIKIKSFNSLSFELNKLKNNKNSLIVLNDFLSSLLIKNDSIFDNSELKLLTYNIPKTEIYPPPPLPVFNVIIDHIILKKKIVKLLKKKSKQKNLSDCGIIINPDYLLCNQLQATLFNDGYFLDILEVHDNTDTIKDWVNKKNKKVVIFFGYKANKYIIDIKRNQLDNICYIEILTNFGEINNNIEYRININWEYAVNYAINSEDFKKFALLTHEKKRSYNYIVKHNNVILCKKNTNKNREKEAKKDE